MKLVHEESAKRQKVFGVTTRLNRQMIDKNKRHSQRSVDEISAES